MSEVALDNRDYTVLVAKTAPSTAYASPKFHQSWSDAHRAIVTLVQKCETFDPDGITIYISSKDHAAGLFRQYRHVTSNVIEEIFNENYPPETLNLLDGLSIALTDYFTRKQAGQTKPNGEMIVVLIDGEPQDRMEIVKTIVEAAEQLDSDHELGIGFVQVGNDLIARGFLNSLDDDLRSRAGAKFDIVHTQTLDNIQADCLTEFLKDIIRD
ncbi:hypothetical protein [Pantanalinema sp. GBBB05]|uniref:hypothetical protein n=1 Tax=Pantanalinema sp. GBBB05 TaxID=2604139 RepID=UPI001E1511B4|nr:hypothetical protein [Pantanalinema sp. GBBB05]